MSAYIDEPYLDDDFQTQEEIELENEIDKEVEIIKDDPSLAFTAFLDYLNSEAFADDEEQIENLGTLIEMAINENFRNRHRHDVSLINAAILWQATKNVELEQ